MFTGGHIILSASVALPVAKKTKIDFLKVALIFIACNLVDLDHLLNFRLDDGTANSMMIHPLHKYGFLLLFAVFMLGLMWDRFRDICMLTCCGLLLHYAGDSVANTMSYQLVPLLITDASILAAIYIYGMMVCTKRSSYRNFYLVTIFLSVYTSATIYYFHTLYVPNESPFVWIYSQVCTVVAILILYALFSKSDFSFKK